MILEPRTTDTGATTDTGDWRHERPILNKLLPEQQSQATTDTGTMNDRHWSYRSHERQEIQETGDTGARSSICCLWLQYLLSFDRSWLQYRSFVAPVSSPVCRRLWLHQWLLWLQYLSFCLVTGATGQLLEPQTTGDTRATGRSNNRHWILGERQRQQRELLEPQANDRRYWRLEPQEQQQQRELLDCRLEP